MQRFDLTLPLSDEIFKITEAAAAKHGYIPQLDLFGHIGTHLDLMGKTYPDDYYTLSGRIFDVHTIVGRDIEASDINMDSIQEKDFVLFHSGCLTSLSYGTPEYMNAPVQLSWDLIHKLMEKKVAIIGLDFAGIRYAKEHRQADSLCAEAGTFVVENIFETEKLFAKTGHNPFIVHCYPMRLADATGLPCRIIAEV